MYHNIYDWVPLYQIKEEGAQNTILKIKSNIIHVLQGGGGE